jgi:biopolymer transport protein ExbB/TolQ
VGIAFSIEFWLLGLLSAWMTASAISILPQRQKYHESVHNLFEQVLGAVRAGDLPRAVLFLEGEDEPMPRVLSAILTEATKFTPKLRVAYKITLESIKRRSQVNLNPLRIVTILAPLLGLVGFLMALIALITGGTPNWPVAFFLLVISLAIAGISQVIFSVSVRLHKEAISAAESYGRKLLNFLMGPESPLSELRQKRFKVN